MLYKKNAEKAEDTKWYAFLELQNPSNWYNNQTYMFFEQQVFSELRE